MIKVSVKMDLDQMKKQLDQVSRQQLPYAIAQALTRTARSAEQAVKGEMRNVFDRPTPWTLKGTFVRPAAKSRPEAEVGITDQGPGGRSQALYLREHLTGGERGNKAMEVRMRAMGILPPGWLAVPSRDGVARDQFGNVSWRTVARILSELEQGGRRAAGRNTFRLFVVRPGQAHPGSRHLAPGIWSVSTLGGDGTQVKPVFLFVPAATYDKVFKLEKVVNRVVKDEFSIHFDREFEAAKRSAK